LFNRLDDSLGLFDRSSKCLLSSFFPILIKNLIIFATIASIQKVILLKKAGVYVLVYNVHTKDIKKLDSFYIPSNDEVMWFHLDVHNSKDQLKKIFEEIAIHPAAKENFNLFSDIPKMNLYENEAVISLFSIDEEDYTPIRLNMLATRNMVITYEEQLDLDLLKVLPKKFMENPHFMSSPGHILFRITENISISFLESIDKIADEIQALEKSVFIDPFENKIGKSVYRWKVMLHELRQIVEPQEGLLKQIGKADFPYINEDAGFYFQDLQSNYARIVAAYDTFKDSLSNIFNLQISLKSDHTNAIMKTLTLVSVIFIPMTFIAGLYGMNFEWMPELKWRWGYFYALILMFGIGGGITLYFRKKGWWGTKRDRS
jgi:magnesium transporter